MWKQGGAAPSSSLRTGPADPRPAATPQHARLVARAAPLSHGAAGRPPRQPEGRSECRVGRSEPGGGCGDATPMPGPAGLQPPPSLDPIRVTAAAAPPPPPPVETVVVSGGGRLAFPSLACDSRCSESVSDKLTACAARLAPARRAQPPPRFPRGGGGGGGGGGGTLPARNACRHSPDRRCRLVPERDPDAWPASDTIRSGFAGSATGDSDGRERGKGREATGAAVPGSRAGVSGPGSRRRGRDRRPGSGPGRAGG